MFSLTILISDYISNILLEQHVYFVYCGIFHLGLRINFLGMKNSFIKSGRKIMNHKWNLQSVISGDYFEQDDFSSTVFLAVFSVCYSVRILLLHFTSCCCQ